ncbi:hypothetical protein [Halohasta litorea]|uniref:Transposase n=1 Tax=Halohasta litorea TaxID=869891 RepID=A0ABD6D6F2_9EURY|nr:hypothetical protein [Halohasta litorea]
MTESTTDPNMTRVEHVVLKPNADDISVAATAEVLRAAGLDQEQCDPNKFDRLVEQWNTSDRWSVTRHSTTIHGDVRQPHINGIQEHDYAGTVSTRLKTRSWHNKMMDTVECPECGSEHTRLSLYGHQDSRSCRAQQNKNEVKERGLQQLTTQSKYLRELIEEHSDVGIKKFATKYVPGSRNKKSVLRNLRYATPNGIKKARQQYLPAPNKKGTTAQIVWRNTDHCIVKTDDAMHVIDIEHPDRIYRRQSLYVNPSIGTLISYNRDGWRVGEAITKYAGKITEQIWHSDHAVIVIETDAGTEHTIKIDHPIEIIGRDSKYPDEFDSHTDAIDHGANISIEAKPTSAGLIPGKIVAADNGVIVEL